MNDVRKRASKSHTSNHDILSKSHLGMLPDEEFLPDDNLPTINRDTLRGTISIKQIVHFQLIPYFTLCSKTGTEPLNSQFLNAINGRLSQILLLSRSKFIICINCDNNIHKFLQSFVSNYRRYDFL